MQIDVSDLYDAFFDIARILWMRMESKGRPNGSWGALGPRYGSILDRMETDVFFAACARRLARQTERVILPSDIRRHLTLHDLAGRRFDGDEAYKYQVQAFDFGTPNDEDIQNRVCAGDLWVRSRAETRILLTIEDDARDIPEEGDRKGDGSNGT